jgi:hypothetical protein
MSCFSILRTTSPISAFIVILVFVAAHAPAQQKGSQAAKPPAGWTLDEAIQQLELSPNDSYLQYVALQLAVREQNMEEVALKIGGNGRRVSPKVDLFSLLTGAHAVQESLQLEKMHGSPLPQAFVRPNPMLAPPNPPTEVGRIPGPRTVARPGQNKPKEADHPKFVAVSTLNGPTVKSHAWTQLLAGRKPNVDTLAQFVPDDFYIVEFRKASKLLEATEISDLWATHLFNQAIREARTNRVGERLARQLALEAAPALISIYDDGLSAIAVTGSDLFWREGSDVTVILRLRQPSAFKVKADEFLINAEKSWPGAARTQGRYRDVDFIHLRTPDRSLSVFSAYPLPNLLIRSNSELAFQRVVDAIRGATPNGQPVHRLGESFEYAYIRTLFPVDAAEEDGFAYLSDPFIRRLVGPTWKLTEARRMECYNQLRMIGHAAMMYRTEYGRFPDSLDAIAKAKCAPGIFNQDSLVCPDGGKYSLSADGTRGICSHHGHPHFLTPCLEIPVRQVTWEESKKYQEFLSDYNQYWRQYFDPIVFRLQMTPQRYRLETIVLPLIDNSIYTTMAQLLGGEPELLDKFPVPKRNIFSTALRFNKGYGLQQLGFPPEAGSKSPGDIAPSKPRLLTPQETGSSNNMKRIAVALQGYHSVHGSLPSQANFDKAGKPLLSWRVHILPYMELDNLYRQFHLDEPWDSEHNKKLIPQMPQVYLSPKMRPLAKGLIFEGTTTYQVPVGKSTLFPPGATGVKLTEVTGGTSNTVMVVDVDGARAVPWTKPADWNFDAAAPLAGLKGGNGALNPVLFGDLSVHFIRDTIPEKKWVALLARTGDGQKHLDISDEVAISVPADITELLGDDLVRRLNLADFLRKGIGNQIGLHIYDSALNFDFNLPEFLGLIFGSIRPGQSNVQFGFVDVGVGFLVASLNAPAYISVPVQNEEVVDQFLGRVDEEIAVWARKTRGEMEFSISLDYYKAPCMQDKTTQFRSLVVRVGPAKLRVHWGRIGRVLYLASKPFILDDLAALSAAGNESAARPVHRADLRAHAEVRMRPYNWDKVLADFRLGWAENNREACLNNLGALSSVARAFAASNASLAELDRPRVSSQLELAAERLHTVEFFCPEGGKYVLAPDGRSMICSHHGSLLSCRQERAPSESSSLGQLVEHFGGLSASLMFLEDGLHAVVIIDRK